MSKLMVEIDYMVAATVIKGIRLAYKEDSVLDLLKFVSKLEQLLDDAVKKGASQ
jgi:hypothetical protein